MEQEAEYLAALPTAQRYRIEGDRLTLQRDDGTMVAIYTAPAPGPARAIPGQLGLPRTGTGPAVLPPAAFAVAAALGLLALVVMMWRSRRAGPPLAG
jgi:hypothetical protein